MPIRPRRRVHVARQLAKVGNAQGEVKAFYRGKLSASRWNAKNVLSGIAGDACGTLRRVLATTLDRRRPLPERAACAPGHSRARSLKLK